MATQKQKFLNYWRNAPLDNPRVIPWLGMSQAARDYDALQEQAKFVRSDAYNEFAANLGTNLSTMPGNSGGFVLAASRQGLNLTDPGMSQLSQFDSENLASKQLDLSNPNPRSPAGVEQNTNPFASIGNWMGGAWDSAFNATKTATRNTMMMASSLWEATTGGIRGAAGEVSEENDWLGAAAQIGGILPPVAAALELSDELAGTNFYTKEDGTDRPNPWEQTHFGQGVLTALGGGLQRDPETGEVTWGAEGAENPLTQQGDGWVWAAEDSEQGQRQRQAAYETAVVKFENGASAEAWTLGRGVASLFTEGPDETAYRNVSGAIDFAAAIFLDPLTYIAPMASAGKAARLGRARGLVEAEGAAVKAKAIEEQVKALPDQDAVAAARAIGWDDEAIIEAEKARRAQERIRGVAERKEERLTAQQRVLAERINGVNDELSELDHVGPALDDLDQAINRAMAEPEGYSDTVARLTDINEELEILVETRAGAKARAGKGRLTLAPDVAEAVNDVGVRLGSTTVDSRYGGLHEVAANLETAKGGRWHGVLTYADEADGWTPAVSRDGEMLVKADGTGNYVNATDEVGDLSRVKTPEAAPVAEEVTALPDNLEMRRTYIPENERLYTEEGKAQFPSRSTEPGVYRADNGYEVRKMDSRYAGRDWEAVGPNGEHMGYHRTKRAAVNHVNAYIEHLAWRAERTATAAAPAAEETAGAVPDLLTAFRDTFTDAARAQFANPQTKHFAQQAKVYRGLEQLLSTPGTTYEQIVNFAAEMGATNRLSTALANAGIDGVDNIGIALGGTVEQMRWTVNPGVLTATALDEPGRARIARNAVSEYTEQAKNLRAEQSAANKQKRQWDAELRQLAREAEVALKQREDLLKAKQRLQDLLGRQQSLLERRAMLLEKQDLARVTKEGAEEAIATQEALIHSMRTLAGLGVDGATGAKYVDAEKLRSFFADTRSGKLVLTALAQIESPGKLARATGHKFDQETVNLLAAAKNEDEVLTVLALRTGMDVKDPLGDARMMRNLTREAGISDQMRMNQRVYAKVGANPMFNRLRSIVPSGRHLELDDVNQMGRELQNYGENLKLPREMVDKWMDAVYTSTTVAARRNIAFDAFDESANHIADNLPGIVKPDAEGVKRIRESLKKASTVTRKRFSDNVQYYQERQALDLDDTGGAFFDEAGNRIEIEDAFTDAEFIQGTIPLPDAVLMREHFGSFMRMLGETGADPTKRRQAYEFVDHAITDVWRTAMLAFRPSYILRNVGEGQMRMYLKGSQSIFDSPLGAIASAMATREFKGAILGRIQRSWDKYNNESGMRLDAYGNDTRLPLDPELRAEQALESETLGHLYTMVDAKYSIGDYRMKALTLARKEGMEEVKSGGLLFRDALAQQILVRRYGKIDQIAVGGDAGYQSLRTHRLAAKNAGMSKEAATVDWFINHPDGIRLVDELESASPGIGALLRDPVGAKNYLYEAPHSVRNVLGLLTSAGNDDLIRVIRDGVVKRKKMLKGKETDEYEWVPLSTIKEAERRQRYVKNMIPATEELDHRTMSVFASEGLPYANPGASGKATGIVTRMVDGFFDVATTAERASMFGPEFRWNYWESIGERAWMLSDEALDSLIGVAERTLPGGRKYRGAKDRLTMKAHPALAQLKKARKDPKRKGELKIEDIESWASRDAARHVEEIFYQAINRKQGWHSMRLAFPFGQAWANSLNTWARLSARNPHQLYKFGRGWRALSGEQSGTAYSIIDPFNNQPANEGGFFFKDSMRDEQFMFKYPTWMTTLGGVLPYNNSMEMIAPVQSLNLAMGGEVPLPGVGPVVAVGVDVAGINRRPGVVGELVDAWMTPFGAPDLAEQGVSQLAPTWARYAIIGAGGNDAFTRSQFKGAAVYTAQRADIGLDDLADEGQSQKFMEQVESSARLATFFRGIGSLLLPASPQLAWKTQDLDGGYNWVVDVADEYNRERQWFGNDIGTANFLDKYGAENLMVALSLTRGQSAVTTPGWEFYQANPEVAEDIGFDALKLIFAGDVSFDSLSYFERAGMRDYATTSERAEQVRSLLYEMENIQAERKGADMGWSQEEVDAFGSLIDARFGGRPRSSIDPGSVERTRRSLIKALETPEIQALPQYPLLMSTWLTYEGAEMAYQQQTGNPNATLKGKGATPYRERVLLEFDQILGEHQDLDRDEYGYGAVALIHWLRRTLLKPTSEETDWTRTGQVTPDYYPTELPDEGEPLAEVY